MIVVGSGLRISAIAREMPATAATMGILNSMILRPISVKMAKIMFFSPARAGESEE